MTSPAPESRRTMLVTGATGFIGARLASTAPARGYRVRTLTRSEWVGEPNVPSRERFFGSFPNRIPAEALVGVDVVAHCAGTGEPGDRLAHAVNVEGTLRLAEAARKAGAGVFVFLSSQSAKPDAISAYGRTKLEAERALLAMEGIRVVILRPGLVTGPGARGLFGRMTASVEGLPVVPLLGGGKAIVQPIHVGDLCEAIIRCDERADELSGRVMSLGDPQGITLAELVREIAIARFGRPKRTVSVPVAPIELLVRMFEALHIALPVNSNNLKGLKTVERMETREDMTRLGIEVRPVRDALGLSTIETPSAALVATEPSAEGPVRILLVGAGRVGLVHAVTLTRLRGAVLAGLVDRSKPAIVFLQRLGIRTSGYASVKDAVAATGAEAAVIATPPATHLDLARECVEAGLAVMVEKPLSAREEQVAEFERLLSDVPGARIQVGYLMPRIPQVAAMLERLRAGDLGKVLGFEGYTLLSFAEGPLEGRWEMNPDVSGGGALINAGGHVLSMIHAAFGDPERLESRSMRIHSERVEDSMVLDLDYGTFTGRQYCSWSIGGFPRQENVLRVRTDRGELVLSGGIASFVSDNGGLEMLHGLDTDVGFNLAPDYVGAGFATELGELRDAARGGPAAAMDIERAGAIERLLFRAYRTAEEVRSFPAVSTEMHEGVAAEPRLSAPEPGSPHLLLDLRGLDAGTVAEFFSDRGRVGEWAGFRIYPEQLASVPRGLRSSAGLGITVPDFLTQSRLLSLGRRLEVARGLGIRGLIGAMRAAAPQGLRDRSATFWVGALGLLGGSLSEVPRGFEGSLLIHPSLVDVALALRRHDMLERMLGVCRSTHPRARIGLHTNLASEAAEALALIGVEPGEVSVLTSPGALEADAAAAELRAELPGATLVAEVGLAPELLHRAARLSPNAWAHGADAVLVGAVADPFLRGRVARRTEREWSLAFPGLAMPAGAPL